DPVFAPQMLKRIDVDAGVLIMGGPVTVMTVTDADARAVGLNRQEFADAIVRRISQAILDYREARKSESLLNGGLWALGATVLAAVVAAIFLSLMRRLRRALLRRADKPIEAFRIQSFELVSAERIRHFLRAFPKAITAVGIVVLVLAWLQFVL